MANDFSLDSRCVALWRFENGALTADSKGTNTLTAVATPVADLADFKEGAACADLEYNDGDYFTIPDASLDAGFPLKSGDTVKKLTWCAWIKQESQPSSIAYIIAKYDITNKRSLAITTVSNALRILWGYSPGTAAQSIDTDIAINNGEWYWIGMRVDGVAKTLDVIVYRANTGVTYTYSTTPTDELYVTNTAFTIGARDGDTTFRWDGRIDEVVIFNDLLTTTEMDKVRKGTFPFGYEGQVSLTLTPQGSGAGSHAYAGQVPLTLTPQANSGGPHEYRGLTLLRLNPIGATSLFDPGEVIALPVPTGGWALGGAGVWASSVPTATEIPAPFDPTGFYWAAEQNPGKQRWYPPSRRRMRLSARAALSSAGPGFPGMRRPPIRRARPSKARAGLSLTAPGCGAK